MELIYNNKVESNCNWPTDKYECTNFQKCPMQCLQIVWQIQLYKFMWAKKNDVCQIIKSRFYVAYELSDFEKREENWAKMERSAQAH